MKLAAFFSGGKDSTYAIYDAQKSGHNIQVLFTVMPKSDESHQSDNKYCEQTRRDICRKGIVMNNLVSFSILEKLK